MSGADAPKPSGNVGRIAANLAVSVGGGVLTHVLVALFMRLNLDSPALVVLRLLRGSERGPGEAPVGAPEPE